MAVTRLTGLTSGMDTDQMVKDLIKAESARLDKVKKNQTYVSWQQDAYRDIISKIKTLQSTYFDTLSPSKNISSSSSFGKFSYSVTSAGSTSKAVEITANADITSKSLIIDEITQLATKDTMSGLSSGMRGVKSKVLDINTFKADMGSEDFQMTLAIGSNSKLIKLTQAEISGLSSTSDLVTALNGKISSAFGTEYNNTVTLETSGEIKFDKAGSTLKVYTFGATSTSLNSLGITTGESSIDFKSKSINELFGLTDAQIGTITINSKQISLSQDDTYTEMMDKINKSGSGVTLNYDTLSDKFQLKSTTEGSINNITIGTASGAETLFSNLFNVTDFTDTNFEHQVGQNASLKINGVSVVQASNSFTFDGINYNLKAVSTNPINVGITVEKASIIENIKGFVTEYNKLIDSISTKYSEKKSYDYEPLTDDEREALSEDEVKSWEDKAKSGILRGSSELDTFLSRIRSALVEPIEGLDINLSSIGISSSSYTDKGKLTIDETKLSEKLDTNFEDVVKLFSQQSDKDYGSSNTSERYKENGIGSRLDDIIKDFTRTTRDTKGNKGILIMKVGITNDSSVVNNELTKKLLEYDSRIDDLEEYLADRETYYYNMFSSMESAMSKLQSQADSLVNMLGS